MATGPSSAQAAAASSGVRATLPGGMGMPSEARPSLAWYSRSFKSAGRGVTGSRAPSKCIDASERDVAVPPGAATALFAQCDLQRPVQLPPRTSRLDHVVDVAALCGDEGVGKLFRVLVDELTPAAQRVGGSLQLSVEDDVDRAPRPHHSDLSGRPRDVEVRPDVLGAHDAVGAAICLARDHGELRHRGFGERVEQLGAVPDDPAVLLRGGTGWASARCFRETRRPVWSRAG